MKINRDFIYDPNLVLYLPLYQLDGASFMSKDAYGHLATVTGALWTPQGRAFDGTDDKIDCGSSLALDLTAQGSVFAWIKYGGWTDIYGVIAGKAGADYPYYLFAQDNTYGGGNPMMLASIKDSGGYKQVTLGVPVIDSVYFIGITWNSTIERGFRNGVEVSSLAAGAAISLPDTTVAIGGKSTDGTRDFKGTIGEVWFYNRALTPLEIQHNYLATKWRYR